MEVFEVTPLVPPQHGLRLIGELDLATVTELKAALESVSRSDPVTLDLAQLTFIDSTGLHAIMEFARSQNGSGPLILASPSATAKRALEIAGLEGHPGVADQLMAAASVVSLADRLKQRRDELGISQSQAARELDVARTAYRLWEMEAAKPAPDRWRLIASWLGRVRDDDAARGGSRQRG